MKMKNEIIAMKLKLQYLFFALLVFTGISASSKEPQLKPRVVVLTDVSTWETDDSESLVRLLVHADLFEIEGLIFTTGWSLDKTRDDFFQLIHDATDAYEKDLPNLMKRSGQKGFQKMKINSESDTGPVRNTCENRPCLAVKTGVSNLSGKTMILPEAT
jgi:hypothetical protein